jgi:hypothetical protein
LIGWNLPDMVTSFSSWYDLTMSIINAAAKSDRLLDGF